MGRKQPGKGVTMAQTYVKRRRSLRRRIKAMQIPGKILGVTMIVLGFVLALALGFFAGRMFGMKVAVDGDAMAPAIESGAAVRMNRLIYKISSPRRMDIIVFNMGQNDADRYYVRRVVGLPGETVQIIDGTLYIDEEPLEFEYNTEYIEDAGLAQEAVVLGLDEYFVIGDNYNQCEDSRSSSIGNVTRDQIVGKAG
ncbi:MAG TPA: signal peptidase I [Candidatus Scybalocola faecavium]|nr:signal peptidase I [Candidatus Scybalocola faecavium]